ncbi:hypothetical protein IEO21_10503 [Rhodonia placenta]|uniref:Uncharacterized protein n=1 Tax=Rhodonia placenta TaxID=104341 RepID=A0A8H7NSC8_9APHY|nr:hypothetical protein IEO21_10503 [Postia placenta]
MEKLMPCRADQTIRSAMRTITPIRSFSNRNISASLLPSVGMPR